MRIAKPLLIVATPIGVALGIHEAFRLAGGLAFLMIALLLMIGAAMAMLVATIRKEKREEEQRKQEQAAKESTFPSSPTPR